MIQDRTHSSSINSRTLLMRALCILFCLIYPASIFALQDQAVIDVQNPTVYDYPVPFVPQEGGMPNYSQVQQMAEPPPGPYQALPEFNPYSEPAMYPNQNAYSIPLENPEQVSGQHGMPDTSPVDNAGYAYPQYAPQPLDNSGYIYRQKVPPPQAPLAQEGSGGIYTDIPQYGGQRQGYPAYGGGNYGYYQPPAYVYPPPGDYQNRLPQGYYQGYYQGQQRVPADNRYMDNRAYPPSRYSYPYSYPQGSGSRVPQGWNSGVEGMPVKPGSTGK